MIPSTTRMGMEPLLEAKGTALNYTMRTRTILIPLLISFAAVPMLGGCGNGGSSGNQATPTASPTPTPTFTPAPGGVTSTPDHVVPADFVAEVTNPYFALPPGTVFNFVNETDDGTEDIVVTVTHDTKVILGVTCTVVHDVVMQDGELTEDTFDWYAQDKDGTVWYFGEDTKAYDGEGSFTTEGSFEAGVNGAKPGFIIKLHPTVGDAYRQEFAPGVAEDRAEILSVDESATVAAGSFQHCVKTKDFSDLEPGITENKLFCPNIGQILAVTVEGGSEREELVSVTHE
jgi:hypothetical protein